MLLRGVWAPLRGQARSLTLYLSSRTTLGSTTSPCTVSCVFSVTPQCVRVCVWVRVGRAAVFACGCVCVFACGCVCVPACGCVCVLACGCACAYVFLHVLLPIFSFTLSLLIRFTADSYEEFRLSGVERHLTAQILCPAGKMKTHKYNTPERKN